MIVTRPAQLDKNHTAELCNELAAGSTPEIVECTPDSDAPANDCFMQVEAHVKRNGGERVIGWALWEMPHVMLEAEFHAVWRRPSDGKLIDLNPREFHFREIHFLPDPARTYKGRQVDNVRRALCNDIKLKQFIYLKGRQFDLLNAGKLADHHGVIDRSMASARLIKEFNAITKQLNALIPSLTKLSRSRQ